jgi:hypothetical protein
LAVAGEKITKVGDIYYAVAVYVGGFGAGAGSGNYVSTHRALGKECRVKRAKGVMEVSPVVRGSINSSTASTARSTVSYYHLSCSGS